MWWTRRYSESGTIQCVLEIATSIWKMESKAMRMDRDTWQVWTRLLCVTRPAKSLSMMTQEEICSNVAKLSDVSKWWPLQIATLRKKMVQGRLYKSWSSKFWTSTSRTGLVVLFTCETYQALSKTSAKCVMSSNGRVECLKCSSRSLIVFWKG